MSPHCRVFLAFRQIYIILNLAIELSSLFCEHIPMNIIQVIPIRKGIGLNTLSYFTSIDVAPGAIVEVPLRSKMISGLVVKVESAQSLKSEIKSADFAIKKVDSLKSTNVFTPAFLKAAEKTADFFAASTGSILNALIPSIILKNIKDIEIGKLPLVPSKLHEKYVIQGDDEERFTNYRSLIRQEFAKKTSVFFCVPTIEDAKRSKIQLEKGIEDYTFMLHGSLTKKTLVDTWNKIQKETHPIVIIATGQFLSMPRHDIHTIILEKENSRSYKNQYRPYLDLRTFVEFYSEQIQARLVMGDILLRTETLWREANGDLVQTAPFKFRSLTTAQELLKDMRVYKNAKGSFKIFSDEVEELIKHNKENSERMFILTTRRGVAPSTVCGDCQNIVMCNNCSSPVVLHKSKSGEQNFFMCHRCGERRSTEEYCKMCGSWKLGTVGIGIDLIHDKIKDRFPDIKVFRIDADTTKTEKALTDTIAAFQSSPGSILLGTEMAMLYISERVDNSAIISIDSLFSIPDFRIHEKIFYLLLKIRAMTARRFILQTRNPEEKILEYALKGNLIDYYRDQIADRERFQYPPFTTLIKITLEGEKDAIVKDMDTVQDMLDPYEVEIFPAFTQTQRGKFVLHGLLKIPRKNWINPDLLMKLRSLPPQVSVKVDPESLL